MSMAVNRGRLSQGFTLIELVVGIIVMSIVLTIVVSIMMPLTQRSVDPIYQVKATELAQSLFNEIAAKAFDENRDPNGGLVRCNEDLNNDDTISGTLEKECSLTASFGAGDGELSRQVFDDVDDFHNYSEVFDILNADISAYYPDFLVTVSVAYVDDYLGTPTPNTETQTSNIKQITLTVTTPNGLNLEFVRFRGNY